MAEKTTVTITTMDGTVKTFSTDTAIVFTVDKVEEHFNKDAEAVESTVSYVGRVIPEPHFDQIIGSLVSHLIEEYSDNPVMTGFYLHSISEHLEKRKNEIMGNLSDDQMAASAKDALVGVFKNMLNNIFD